MAVRSSCFSALLAVVALSGCGAAAGPKPLSVEEARQRQAQAAEVLDDFHDAAAKADLARYFSHLVDESVFLGTDATERWDKQRFFDYAKPHFERGKAWSFKAVRRALTLEGDVVYFDEDLGTGFGPARGSGVLALRGDRYVILQYNLAITVPNERFDLVREAAEEAAIVRGPALSPVGALAWLAGSWHGVSASGLTFEETLSSPADQMLGMSRASKEGRTVFSERLRLERKDGKLSYVAHPSGQAETVFTSTTEDAGLLVFENPNHDYPKRIRYERVGGELIVTIDDGAGGRSETFRLRPAIVARQLAK